MPVTSRKSFPPAPWNFDRFIPLREITINEKSDFPAPVLGVIYLEDRTHYRIGTNMQIGTDRLVMDEFTVIKGIDTDNSRIQYDGTGDMITSVDATWLIEDITLDANNGQIFNCSGNNFYRTRNVCISDADQLGSFTSSGSGVFFFESFIAESFNDGFDFFGSWNILQFSVASNVQIFGEFLDLGTATFNSIGISEASVFLATAGSTFLKGAANSANINAGGLARVTNCVINNLGSGTILDGVTEDDTRWRFLGNQGIRNSRPDALGSFSGNSTETVIVTQNVPVKINATWTQGPVSQFTVDSSGTFTFIGEVDVRLPIDIVLSILGTTGSAITYTIYVAINGSVITDSGIPIPDVTNTKAKSGSTMWQHTFTNGDTVEFFIENNDGTNNVEVVTAVGRIN